MRTACIIRVLDGVVYYGVVQDIEQGKKSGERLYFVKYTDGDIEHLRAEQVRELSCAQAHAAGGDAEAAHAAEGRGRDPDEEIIDLPESEKKADVLRRAFIKRVLDSVARYGVVQDIEQEKESGERQYFVQYTDGDVEHLKSDQARMCSCAAEATPEI